MRSRPSHPLRLLALLLLPWLASCGDGGPVTPTPTAPVITVSGVEHGQNYSSAVTIHIEVDRGSYSATLNGAPFLSGRTVEAEGAYRLVVTAQAGSESATRTLDFTITRAPLTGESFLIVRMLDLGPEGLGGGGDAIVLTDSSAAGMRHGVIDAGPRGVGGSLNHRFVADRLVEIGADTLEFLQLTHAHADHFGAMPEIFDRVHVRRFLYNGQRRTLASYQNVLTLATMRADSVIVLAEEREYALGRGATTTSVIMLPPLPAFLNTDTNDGAMLNEGSLGTLVRRGSFRMFFTGDSEYEANRRWRTTYADHTRNLTVLKVGHHGANNAIFDAGTTGPATWLTHTAPRLSIISANGVSHPRQRALARLLQQPNNQTYCTHVHGTITIRVNPEGTYQVSVQRNADADCVPGSAADT